MAGRDGFLFTEMAKTVQKSSGRQNDGSRGDHCSVSEFHSGYRSIFGDYPLHAGGNQRESELGFDHLPHVLRIEVFTNVRTDGLYGRPASGSNPADMGQCVIGRHAHLATDRINLASDVALCRPADAAITREISDAFKTQCDARHFSAHPGGGKCGFDARMASTNHNDVELVHLESVLGWF